MRKVRLACMQWYSSRIVAVLKVLMTHVVHRRMKRNHYDQLHARVCAAALLPIALHRMSANCQVMLRLPAALRLQPPATCSAHTRAFNPYVC